MGLSIDPTLSILGQALNGLAQRESASATNLANIDTPGYRPVGVSFEDTLQAQAAGRTTATRLGLRTTNARHLDGSRRDAFGMAEPTVSTIAGSGRNDGNGVDVEAEMTTLTETQIRYAGVAKLVAGKIGMLREVASKGGGA